MAEIDLIIGGARSGKSRHAEALVTGSGLDRIYVATAEAFDDEMAERIARHRTDRGDGWTTVEAPLDLAGALVANAGADRIVLVDCLTLWLSNLILAERDIGAAVEDLFAALSGIEGRVVMVSNEVGWGIVPETPLGRRFRDEQGLLNQRVAARAARVTLVAAGLPLRLK